eukprot:1295601-Rhodomonas_salina.1
MQTTAFSVQFVPGARLLVFDYAVCDCYLPTPPIPHARKRCGESLVHGQIKYKKTQSGYNLYQQCVFLHLISGSTMSTAHIARRNQMQDPISLVPFVLYRSVYSFDSAV